MVVRKPTYKKWWLDFQGIYNLKIHLQISILDVHACSIVCTQIPTLLTLCFYCYELLDWKMTSNSARKHWIRHPSGSRRLWRRAKMNPTINFQWTWRVSRGHEGFPILEDYWKSSFMEGISTRISWEIFFHWELETGKPPELSCVWVDLWKLLQESLGGGNSNIFHFHPDPWRRFPIWLIFFRSVETTN